MNAAHTASANGTDTVSLYDIIKRGQSLLSYLLSKWWVILITAVIGGAAGLTYAVLKPITYTANLNFLVEEGKGGGGGLASLAGQFGFDLGGLAGSSGLLSGDNVLVFLKSPSLAKETLLTPYDSSGHLSLADKYAEVTLLRRDWKENAKIGKEIFFPVQEKGRYTRLQDSLLQVMVSQIVKDELLVDRPDKKASFVQVSVQMRDELLSKYFCERLVKEATERYVNSKTSRQTINVSRLQRRADSIAALLNRKTFATAAAQEQLLDVNPGFKTAAVNAEVTGRDKTMLATIYGEIIKNLEISKVALSQETPTIQVVDAVDIPLKVNKTSKALAILLGAALCVFATIIILSLAMLGRTRFYVPGTVNA